MKKAFDQTVRDIKRGVNKKVLKVPSIEQKVLDATSNEPWGPHGSLLADIALASRNYHEYQMIMSVIWKRVNDTGKNWRHVYKGLTVLDYLVANGSERVIDEIREHSYQITTLSEFQYIDSNARDQGSNVRKKSQSLVALVNDKEKIQEVRQKAAANWDKFHNASGGVKYRPGSYPGPGGFDDDRYGSRDEDRNGYGREREWGDDKYGSRDGEERYGRDRYRDDEYRGRRSVDGDNYGRRSRSSDRERERAYEDEGQYSSRGSYAKTDDQSHDGRPIERKSSEQNLGVPPSYEDAVGGGRSPIYSERDGEVKSSPPPVTTRHETTVSSSPEAPAVAPPPVAAIPSPPAAASNKEHNGFDEFDPRGSFPAAPPTSGVAEMDLFGSPSDSFSVNALALVPTTATSEADSFTNSNPPGQTFVAASSSSISSSQPFEDPFGDGPFRAVSSTDGFSAPPQSASVFGQSAEPPQSVPESGNKFGYGGNYDQNTDILADLLPPAGPSQTNFQTQPGQLPSQTGFPSQTVFPSQTGFPAQPNQTAFPPSFQGQPGQPTPHQDGFHPHGGQTMALDGFQSQTGSVSQAGFPGSNGQPAHLSNFYGGFEPQGSSATVPPMVQVTTTPAAPQLNASSFYQQPQPQPQVPAITASTGALAIVPQQPSKFETKSTVWADTLNRGLVNLNIAGSKTNPLSDIGVDFEALNRKEKRMEKTSTTPMTSNVTMGKAMGSGSGFGRAGAGALRPQVNPMMGSSMVGPGGYGAGYGGMNQPMGQYQMQPPSTGFPPGSAMAGTYNPMMGRGGGGYGQQPYGGGGGGGGGYR
ncbi:clathrin interactor EPSIN 2-like [Cynara cardunculus var. scolymus]|uniref:clathrin interactor EPSIN 2-like n=1 Tax=Cynara cardunculus var. scolymus TaxID=59895 RepID=UPI000D625DFC|nr:clathrin interactor EPSIN 2-like [Cynara cardunculus var. scolymus]XP_024983254.1 clathrin interactor EPSIN 2-like [Cynara cardunculus var. scolymus]XP_024983255.1 clathrin interactor EPSIN 2-like [Cynara cardunculus var. scolymus]XP_024983256.1 clathrin interactor EPSIN 2-like [Cynara cardunculus var. scolymus]